MALDERPEMTRRARGICAATGCRLITRTTSRGAEHDVVGHDGAVIFPDVDLVTFVHVNDGQRADAYRRRLA